MKIEIEERTTQFLARLKTEDEYVEKYGSPLVFRAKTKKRVIELAKQWLAQYKNGLQST